MEDLLSLLKQFFLSSRQETRLAEKAIISASDAESFLGDSSVVFSLSSLFIKKLHMIKKQHLVLRNTLKNSNKELFYIFSIFNIRYTSCMSVSFPKKVNIFLSAGKHNQ